MKLSEVGYRTENAVPLYTAGIDKCKTLYDLREFLRSWEGLADDALSVAMGMDEKKFKEFRKAVKIERSGKFSGEGMQDIVAVILMPELMFLASVAEQKYNAPWGTCVIRLKSLDVRPHTPKP